MSGDRQSTYTVRNRAQRLQALQAKKAEFVDRDINGPTKPTGKSYVDVGYVASGYIEDEGKA